MWQLASPYFARHVRLAFVHAVSALKLKCRCLHGLPANNTLLLNSFKLDFSSTDMEPEAS